MELFICCFCDDKRKTKKSLIAHETFCKNNPNRKTQNLESAWLRANTKVVCKFCENHFATNKIKKHQEKCKKNPKVIKNLSKNCPVCNKIFMTAAFTCSYACSNTYFRHGREGGIHYASDEVLIENKRYRDLCFRYHDKKCIICNEKNIISVHHLNKNHNDNKPENLIPLCPTHHLYCHSRYYYLVESKIKDYIIEWKTTKLICS